MVTFLGLWGLENSGGDSCHGGHWRRERTWDPTVSDFGTANCARQARATTPPTKQNGCKAADEHPHGGGERRVIEPRDATAVGFADDTSPSNGRSGVGPSTY
jgi:hypothetical protein